MSQPSDAVLMTTMREVTAPIAAGLKLQPEMLEHWFHNMYYKLELLLTNRFRDADARLYRRAKAYRAVIERLVTHPDVNKFLSKGDIKALNEGIGDILSDVNDALNSSVSPAEISLFCQVAESGRSVFQSKHIDPDSFTEKAIFDLAHKIRDNYPAYEDTLRGLKV